MRSHCATRYARTRHDSRHYRPCRLDCARPLHTCRLGCPATSAPGLGCHICTRTGLSTCHICTWAGLPPGPICTGTGPGSPCHICTGASRDGLVQCAETRGAGGTRGAASVGCREWSCTHRAGLRASISGCFTSSARAYTAQHATCDLQSQRQVSNGMRHMLPAHARLCTGSLLIPAHSGTLCRCCTAAVRLGRGVFRSHRVSSVPCRPPAVLPAWAVSLHLSPRLRACLLHCRCIFGLRAWLLHCRWY